MEDFKNKYEEIANRTAFKSKFNEKLRGGFEPLFLELFCLFTVVF